MLFPTVTFAVFFLLVYVANWLTMPRPRLWRWTILTASFLFYGWWDWRFVLLLIAAALGNQFFALRLAATRGDSSERRRPAAARVWLAVAVAANLAVLGLFKYYDFFAASLDDLLGAFGISTSIPLLDLVLPVGISFLTFRMLTYVIDVARGGLDPVPLLDFAVYVAFFPYLLAGPIARAAEFLPQLRGPRDPRSVDAARAFRLILGGLAKKVLIADYLATHLVNGLFAAPDQYSSWETLVGIYAYAVQIYCDFSGYTDIALGVALLLGFELPENFAAPYAARSVREFWRRWHITLSTWLRDYLYIPLGGNRRRASQDGPQPDAHDAARRALAWGRLDLRALGRAARRRAGRGARRAGPPPPGGPARTRRDRLGQGTSVARRLQLRRLRLGLLQGRLHRQRRGRPRPARHRSGQRRQRGHAALVLALVALRRRRAVRPARRLGALRRRDCPAPAGWCRACALRRRSSSSTTSARRAWPSSSTSGSDVRRDDWWSETSVDAGTREAVGTPAGHAAGAAAAAPPPAPPSPRCCSASSSPASWTRPRCDATPSRCRSAPGARRCCGSCDPMTALSGAVGLDEAAVALDRALGRDDGVHHARRDLAGKDDPPIWPRAVTARKPLRLYVAGDSMAGQFGGPLAAMAEQTGLVRAARRLPREQRTEPAGLLRLAPAPHRRGHSTPAPEAIVFLVGGNDAQDVEWDGRVLEVGTQAWLDVYRLRVAEAMEVATAGGRRVYWVGQPIMRDRTYGERMAMLNDVYEKEAALHEGVTYVDTWDLMAGKDGEYAAYLRGPDGDLERMRQADGVHLTRAGGDRIAARVLEVIRDDWDMGGGSP